MTRRYGIILAGGLGKRLGVLGELLPKALLPFGDSLLIDTHVKDMKEAGINHIYVVTHPHFRTQFNIWYNATKHEGITLVEQSMVEYGGGAAVKAALNELYFPKSDYLIVCGDGYYGDDRYKACGMSITNNRYAALGVRVSEEPWKYGRVVTNGPYIENLLEKCGGSKVDLVSTGVYWFPDASGNYNAKKINLHKAVESLTRSKRGEFEISDIAKAYIDEGVVVTHPVPTWIDVGTPEDYQRALKTHLLSAIK